MVELTYNGRLPSANDFINFNRVNRYQGAQMKRKYTQELAEVFRSQTQERFKGHVTCTVNFYEDTMRRDDDNVISGLKFILDGLVTAGILKDDSPRYCHVRAERFQSRLIANEKKIPYITVKIEESDLGNYQ